MIVSLFATMLMAAEPYLGDINPYLYPSKTALIAVVDLAVARESGLFDEQLQDGFDRLLQGNDQIKQLSRILDFDPREQLKSVTICGSDGRGDRSFLLIINGKFPYARFTEALDKMVDDGELSLFDVNELNVYYNHRQRNAMYFAVIDTGTIIATPSKDWMDDSVEGLTELRTLDGSLPEQMKWKSGEPMQVMRLAGTFPEQARQMLARNPQIAPIADKLVGYNASVQLSENPRIDIRLTMTDEKAAEQASFLFSTLLDFGKAAMANNPRQDLREAMEKLRIDPSDEHVVAELTLSRDLFEQIMENNRSDRQRMIERRRQRREQSE